MNVPSNNPYNHLLTVQLEKVRTSYNTGLHNHHDVHMGIGSSVSILMSWVHCNSLTIKQLFCHCLYQRRASQHDIWLHICVLRCSSDMRIHGRNGFNVRWLACLRASSADSTLKGILFQADNTTGWLSLLHLDMANF